ncbi:MAG: hypothetical protein ACLUNO_00515 [Oscillospiraceae bacterium]
MEQKRTLSKLDLRSADTSATSPRITLPSATAEDPAEIERDIIAGRRRSTTSRSTSMSGSAITTARRRKSAPCPRSGRARSSARHFTDRRYIAILMNKYIFSKVFSDFYGRRCVQASAVDAALLRKALAGDCRQGRL